MRVVEKGNTKGACGLINCEASDGNDAVHDPKIRLDFLVEFFEFCDGRGIVPHPSSLFPERDFGCLEPVFAIEDRKGNGMGFSELVANRFAGEVLTSRFSF